MPTAPRPGAVAMAERALKVVPNQPAMMDTLAMALAAESRLPEAIELQKQVVDLAPGSPLFRLNLAKLHLQSGDKSAAREALESGRNKGLTVDRLSAADRARLRELESALGVAPEQADADEAAASRG